MHDGFMASNHLCVIGKFNNPNNDPNLGTQYTFLAVDAKTRFIIHSVTGQRTTETADAFLTEIKKRVPHRFQLNTDCWRGYFGQKNSVKNVFGKEIDHMTEQKFFWKKDNYISRRLAKTERKARIGNPDIMKGSTSYVERTNLTLRHFNRRFTRCTLAFSKKLLNLRYSMSLFLWHFNFARKHTQNRTTPAIAIGIATAIMNPNELWQEQSNGA
jgi:IS1 family transposase